jgi:hypothetical protein
MDILYTIKLFPIFLLIIVCIYSMFKYIAGRLEIRQLCGLFYVSIMDCIRDTALVVAMEGTMSIYDVQPP